MENETKGGGGSFWKKESRLQLERNVFMEGGGVRDHSLSLSGNAKWKRITGSPVGNERWETTVSVNSITRGDLYRLKPFWTNVSLLLSVVFYSIFVSCALTSGFFFIRATINRSWQQWFLVEEMIEIENFAWSWFEWIFKIYRWIIEVCEIGRLFLWKFYGRCYE